MNFEEMLSEQYREDISGEDLTEDALISAEQYFESMAKDPGTLYELMHHSRINAMLYLALKAEQRARENNPDEMAISGIKMLEHKISND